MATSESQAANAGATVEATATGSSKSWRYGILAASALALVALYPSFLLWYDRGANCNGFYALQQYDEEFYAGYIQALSLGRPRKSDPAQCGGSSTYESLFSIQVVPSQLIAFPIRLLGIPVSIMFMLLTPLIAFMSAIAVFFLLRELTQEAPVSAVGGLIVLCLGTLLTGEGLIGDLFGTPSNFRGLLFLRRYLPGVAFPLLFAFFAFTWRAFTAKANLKYSVVSGALLVALIFSYVYLWTFAAAWCACFLLMVWLGKAKEKWDLIYRFLPIAALGAVALLIFFTLVSRRTPSSDQVVALQLTHAPDLFRYSEIACLVIAIGVYLYLRRKPHALTSPTSLFTFSLLLTPFVVFNQQILTGRSLQPYHYEFYVCNYVTILAAILAAWILWKHRILKAPMVLVGCLALAWGFGEIAISASHNRALNVQRDALISVADKMSGEGLVFSRDVWTVSNHISTFTSSPVLWALHTPICVGFTPEETKKRFYMYLYYSGYSSDSLRSGLRERNYILQAALFGYERAGAKLQESKRSIDDAEIERAVEDYGKFVANFTLDVARNPQLTYVITTGSEVFPANFDLWYQKDNGERIGNFVLYRVTLREP